VQHLGQRTRPRRLHAQLPYDRRYCERAGDEAATGERLLDIARQGGDVVVNGFLH
jgi:hypothetical protein